MYFNFSCTTLGDSKPLRDNHVPKDINQACHDSKQSPNHPKTAKNHLEPPKDVQNLQNRSKIEDFMKSSWNLTILDIPHASRSWSRDSC